MAAIIESQQDPWRAASNPAVKPKAKGVQNTH